jgi:diadenosine tetraphosphate (Ap4A) HIT family hydrolase
MKKKTSTVNIENGKRNASYLKVLQKIDSEGICPFCEKNFLKHHPKKILFKTKYWIVTTNGWPYKATKNHFLMVYRPKHINHIEEMPKAAFEDKLKIIQKLAQDKKIKGGTLMMRFGSSNHTGASVEHLHFHLIEPNKKSSDYDPTVGVLARVG